MPKTITRNALVPIATLAALALASFGAYSSDFTAGQWTTEGLCHSTGPATWKTLHVVAEHFKDDRFHISAELDGKLIERDIPLHDAQRGLSAERLALLAGWSVSAVQDGPDRFEEFAAKMKGDHGIMSISGDKALKKVEFSISQNGAAATCIFKPAW